MIDVLETMCALRGIPRKNSLPEGSLNFSYMDIFYPFTVARLKELSPVDIKDV